MSAPGRSNVLLVTVVLALLLMTGLSPLAQGTSFWLRSGKEFNSLGSQFHVVADSNGLRISLDMANATMDWKNMSISGPAPRYGHSMAIDPISRKAVLFGGLGPTAVFGDTWVLDLDNMTWKNATPLFSPSPRWAHRMVYDSAHGVFIMFGGKDYSKGLGDTWAYNLTNNVWTPSNIAGNPPSELSDFAMAYDSDLGNVFVVGGHVVAGQFDVSDSYIYSHGNQSWTKVKSFPLGPRSGCAMVYDTDIKKFVFFGGTTGSSYYQDIYRYNPAKDSWYSMPVGANQPPQMAYQSMVYDIARGETALFGGYQVAAPSSQMDLWFYNVTNAVWTKQGTTSHPAARENSAMVYDQTRDQLLVYGGDDDTNNIYSDTWVFGLKKLFLMGTYTSEARDLGANASFGKVNIDGTYPNFTTIGVQLRTAKTYGSLMNASFVGPDGTGTTFYDKNNVLINALNNGNRWLQYKVRLNTANTMWSPVMHSIKISYNLIPDINILSPKGGEKWNGVVTLNWDAHDWDNGTLKYDVILLKGTSTRTTLATDLTPMSFSWDTNGTANGTYRIIIAVKDNDIFVPLTVENTSASFEIFHQAPNTPPVVDIQSPADGATLITNQTKLTWKGTDAQHDSLTYYLYFDTTGGKTLVQTTVAQQYNVTGLKDNTTYYWTVKANDGRVNGSAAALRTFHVQVNHPPRFTSTPVTTAYIGAFYTYTAQATDPDPGDTLQYSISNAPLAMTIDKTSGAIYWMATSLSIGNYNVVITVTDGHFIVNQSFVLTVSMPPVHVNHPPSITSNPVLTASVGTIYNYQVTATDQDTMDTLNYTLSTKPTGMNIGLISGLIEWTPTPSQVGTAIVKVGVSDGRATVTQTFNITVTQAPGNHPPVITKQQTPAKVTVGNTFTYQVSASDQDSGDNLVYILKSAPAGMSISTGGLISWTPTKDDVGTHDIQVNVSDGKGGFDQQTFSITVAKKSEASTSILSSPMLLWVILMIVILVVVIVAVAVLATRRKAKAVPPLPPVAPLVIDDIFLIYKDGRLISHHTRKLKPDMDDQVLTGMFTAVQDFIKTSLGGDEGKAVNEIAYGDQRVLIEHGRLIYIAAVVQGEGLKDMHDNMKAAVFRIETECGPALTSWEGDVKALAGAKPWVQMLISGQKIV